MSAEDRPERHLPYPELAEPRRCPEPYQIRDSRQRAGARGGGSVDLVQREMWVPLEAGARATSRHELGHVCFSPPRPLRVSFDARILAGIEDARVNLALGACGTPLELDAEASALLAIRDAKRGDYFALWMRAVAGLGSSSEADLIAPLRDLRGEIGAALLENVEQIRVGLERARLRSRKVAAPYASGLRLAREAARVLRALGLLDAQGCASSSAIRSACVSLGTEKDAEDSAELGAECSVEIGADGTRSGRLRIAKPVLARASCAARGSGGWRAAREGSVMRYSHRWTSDRAVFRKRGRSGGGSVLVDSSGSMKLRTEDLERLLLANRRGMQVAIYSGRGDAGELRIVAAAGRRADASQLELFARATSSTCRRCAGSRGNRGRASGSRTAA